MERDLAELLIDELGKHKELYIEPNKELFIELLERTHIPKTNQFYSSVPMNKQTVEEKDVKYALEIRRILNNRTVEKYVPSYFTRLKQIAKEKAPSIVYSSDVFCMRIAADECLAKLLLKCNKPISILAKQKKYFIKDGKINGVWARPLLIIPGESNNETIGDWEVGGIMLRTGKLEKSTSYASSGIPEINN